jgi:hypothetical protein
MQLNKHGIFHLLGLFAGEFFDWFRQYELDTGIEQTPFSYDKDTVLSILKNAASGESDKVQIAKAILIKMEEHQCKWEWKEYWINEPEIGYDIDPNDKTVPNELHTIVEIINNDIDIFDFKRIFQEFNI